MRGSHMHEKEVDDLQLLERDVTVGMEDAMPSIHFSDHVHQTLYESMYRTIVVKLLGRKIGYRALSNRISSLWKPLTPIFIMDLENDYFLVKLQMEVDYIHALTEGAWIVYGYYLTVQPWTEYFSTFQLFPSNVVLLAKGNRMLCVGMKRGKNERKNAYEMTDDG
ncbi:hypothetical protein Goari_020437 [Gossypium aridum]|uniref:DUF4283 domain-containing protein n=1 Tax=Gossypium aridum TaxID=34290 RepID=A0A7J8YST8_GOSAI|nr:hypothetical protein [Gossypium aridum]